MDAIAMFMAAIFLLMYALIRKAVRDGISDALKRLDKEKNSAEKSGSK